ncbi:MAG: 50S ribosomal protein L11 methyltransferase [Candidatus Solibacter usitatus]|nr:50S ribosomal protein L11 methyltransferase [Candidatus Solibacter usitatus]
MVNWNEAWQRQWKPFVVGRRLFLAPPWDSSSTPAGRMRLDLHDGNFFGNGDHPTTRMCLALMESIVRPGCRFVDIGCGTGLLSMAAMLLGAAKAGGCDIEAGAIEEARRRMPQGIFHHGSTEMFAEGAGDVVAANLALGVLEQMERELFRVTAAGGTLIVSGVLEEQRPQWEAVFPGSRWQLRSQMVEEGWLAAAYIAV